LSSVLVFARFEVTAVRGDGHRIDGTSAPSGAVDWYTGFGKLGTRSKSC
jgi:hypothetical protein